MRWYLNLLKYWLAYTAVTVSTIVFAQDVPEQTPSKNDNSVHVLQQVQLDALKEIQKKDIEMLRIELAAVNKRVDDRDVYSGQGIDRLGVYASILGTLITVLLAGLGLLGFISVTRKTKAEAQDAAKAWFEDKAGTLESRIKEIEENATSAESQIFAITQDVTEHGDAAKRKHDVIMEQAINDLQARIGQSASDEPGSEKTGEARALVQIRAEELKKTPEDSYSFEDWNTRAHAAYGMKKFEDAAFFWLKAAQIPNSGVLNVVRALFSRGFAQGLQGQIAASIVTYDDVVRHFGEVREIALWELIAQALMNKGIAQGNLNQYEAAITTYDEMIRHFGEDNDVALKVLVAKSLVNKGIVQGLLGNDSAAIVSFDLVVQRFGEIDDLALVEQVSRALICKGVRQGLLEESDAAIVTYDEVVHRLGDASEVILKGLIASALVNKGITQGKLSLNEAAILTFNDVVQRFIGATELNLQEQVAKALLNKGYRQVQLGASDAAIDTYDNLVNQFGEANDTILKELVARALMSKGIQQSQLNEGEAAIVTYDNVVHRFGESSEVVLQEFVARALINKAIQQSLSEKHEASVATFDDVVRRFGEAGDLTLRVQVVIALVSKGNNLGRLNLREASIAAYEEAIHRFGKASEETLRENVARAHNGIGFSRMCQGKEMLGKEQFKAAEMLFLEALGHFDQALELLVPELLNGFIVGNRAYVLVLLDHKDEAEEEFSRALRAPIGGGQALYNGTLSDFDIHPISEDQAMRELVERQWQIWLTEQGAEPYVIS